MLASVLPLIHRFSYLKFTLLLIFILNFEIQEPIGSYRRYFQRDLSFCRSCFQHQTLKCQQFFETIEFDTSLSPLQTLVNILPRSAQRSTDFLRYRNNTQSGRIIAKYLQTSKLDGLQKSYNVTQLEASFFNPSRLDGLQFCPEKQIDRFVKYLEQHTQHNTLSIWLHLSLNAVPIFMTHLEALGYPVPKHFAICGFTLYQAYAGRALIHYYNASFKLKLHIAQQLLEAAILFSRGFAGFRIYITDLNPDNVVFDEQLKKLYFVDLDTVLIVDSESRSLGRNTIHKHKYIECNNCFAYSQQDICERSLSDINLFSACQLLREDLSRDRKMGFLYPVPVNITAAYPNLEHLLNDCVDCSNTGCMDRFAATLELIDLFDIILQNFY